MTVKGEEFKDEDRKWGQDNVNYDGFTSKGVEGMGVAIDLFSKSVSMSASFTKPSKEEQLVTLKNNIRELLEQAGFSNVEFSQPMNNASFYVKVAQSADRGMIEFGKALSSRLEGDGRDVAGPLSPKDAQELALEEAKRLELSLQTAALMRVSLTAMDNTGGQRYGIGVQAPSYKDVDLSGLPGCAVESLREDGFTSKFSVEKHTLIKASEGMGKIVQEKLEAAGFDVHRQEGSPNMSVSAKPNGADANIDNISNALAGANLIPAMAAQEINAVQPVAPAAIAPVAPAATQAIKMNATR